MVLPAQGDWVPQESRIQEGMKMHTQEIEFAVQKENGIVTKVGKTAVYQPETGFKGRMGRLQDAPAMDTQGKNKKG